MLEIIPRHLKYYRLCKTYCTTNDGKGNGKRKTPKIKIPTTSEQGKTPADTKDHIASSSAKSTDKQRPTSQFVARARLLDYWQHSDHALEAEFESGKVVLMVDKEPLVEYKGHQGGSSAGLKMVTFDSRDLRRKVNLYGLEIGTLNSALLDIVQTGVGNKAKDPIYTGLFGCALRLMPPPEESGISIQGVRKELGSALGGRFVGLRYAMLTMADDYNRNLLAKFQALTKWYKIYRRCPTCGNVLMMRASKALATCLSCDFVFYPTISPVAICLVRDPGDEHCLLVQHKHSVGSIFSAISGFCSPGESLQETVKREVAEEVGLECYDVQPLNMSQSWPIPNNSLMCAFTATADMTQRLDLAPEEIEYAQWFSREEVAKAVERVDADPMLHFVHLKNSDYDSRHQLKYIPPRGAIAYHIIKNWVNRAK